MQQRPLQACFWLQLTGVHWGIVLGLLDQGEELHAAVVQVLVHQDAVKQVSVLDLQQPGRVFQLQEVVLLQADKKHGGSLQFAFPSLIQLSSGLFGPFYREGSAGAVGAEDPGVSPGLSKPLGTRRLDENHEGLQSRCPQRLDVLERTRGCQHSLKRAIYLN